MYLVSPLKTHGKSWANSILIPDIYCPKQFFYTFNTADVSASKNTSEGDRTLDHRLKRLTLYQLSYAGYSIFPFLLSVVVGTLSISRIVSARV